MIKHILCHAFGYKMLLNQDWFSTSLYFICPVCCNDYRRCKALSSQACVTWNYVQWDSGKKRWGCLSQSALKVYPCRREIRKANRLLRNWGTYYLVFTMRTSEDLMKMSSSSLKIHTKELFFLLSSPLDVVEVKNRNGLIKH